MDEKFEQELQQIMQIERRSLNKFKSETDPLIKSIEHEKEELKLEEKININLDFIHYKIKGIHGLIEDIEIILSKEKNVEEEVKVKIRQMIDTLVEIQNGFLPGIKKDMEKYKKEAADKKVYAKIQQQIKTYEQVIQKLEKALKVDGIELSKRKKIRNRNIQVNTL